MPVDGAAFREAMSRFPSGVTVVTTVDDQGGRWGFTASAFASLSSNPTMVLVCLDCAADCHPVFTTGHRFAVSILAGHQKDLALRFASKGVDKFAGYRFHDGATGLPLAAESITSIECHTAQLIPGGDHTILIGVVESVHLGEGSPLIFYRRQFFTLDQPPARCG